MARQHAGGVFIQLLLTTLVVGAVIDLNCQDLDFLPFFL